MVLLGDLAVRTEWVLKLNPESGEITNATIPEEYVRPPYREGGVCSGVRDCPAHQHA